MSSFCSYLSTTWKVSHPLLPENARLLWPTRAWLRRVYIRPRVGGGLEAERVRSFLSLQGWFLFISLLFHLAFFDLVVFEVVRVIRYFHPGAVKLGKH